MLNEMRVGKLSQKSIDIFRGLNRPIHYDDDLDGTELCVIHASLLRRHD